MYGYSVSLSGNTLAVGSPSDNFEFKNDQGRCLRDGGGEGVGKGDVVRRVDSCIRDGLG